MLAAQQPAGHAPAVTVDGHRLVRLASATRSTLFGTVDLYSVEIFMPGHPASLDEARSRTIPKAILIRRLFSPPFTAPVPPEWDAELQKALEPDERVRLESTLRRLNPGDAVWVRYSPGTGTTATQGGRTLVTRPGVALADAVLNICLLWSGVSEDLRQQLLETPRARIEPGVRLRPAG
jgi:hypothetical protein